MIDLQSTNPQYTRLLFNPVVGPDSGSDEGHRSRGPPGERPRPRATGPHKCGQRPRDGHSGDPDQQRENGKVLKF